MTFAQATADMRMTILDRRMVLKLLGVGAGAAAFSGNAMAQAAAPSPSTSLRRQIAAYVAEARFEDLPFAAVEKAKEQIVFFFGRAFANTSSARARRALDLAPQIGANAGATVIGNRVRLAPEDAALVNASLFGESLPLRAQLNDAVHPGVVTLPVALAIGEMKRVAGRELLLALVLGYEVLGKLREAARSACGATSIVAGYAATAAAGRLFGLDREQMFDALGHAGGSYIELPDSIELGYWEILTTLQRPHRATGHDCAAVELLADLMDTHQLDRHSIAAIKVVLPASGSRMQDMALAASGPFETMEVSFESGHAARWAKVTVHTRDGRTLECARDFFTYDLTPDMWHHWLHTGGRNLFQWGQLPELLRLIHNLENVDDVSTLLAATIPTPARARV